MDESAEEMPETTRRLAFFEARVEQATKRVSRILHDDLGGLLVAAVMDTAWAEHHCGSDPVIRERLARIRQGLSTAIDLKRQLIEDLCPSLLENFGLFTALKWYHKHNCAQASLACSETYPDQEPPFAPAASTALFRIIQEALITLTRQPSATMAHLGLDVANGELCIRIHHDGDVLSLDERKEADLVSYWLVEHRVKALGGTVSMSNPDDGGMTLSADIPLTNVTQDAGGIRTL